MRNPSEGFEQQVGPGGWKATFQPQIMLLICTQAGQMIQLFNIKHFNCHTHATLVSHPENLVDRFTPQK